MTTTATAAHTTREGYLVAAIEAMRPMFAAIGEELPTVRVSVGWPGGRGKKSTTIGQCWPTATAEDEISQIFVSPVLADPADVLETVAHELIHAIDDCQSGHKGRFAKIAKALGFLAPMTSTPAGEELKAALVVIAEELGEYPHGAISLADNPKKQSTRQLKIECSEGSGYIVRMTQKWISEYGTPSCPCHDEPMQQA